MATLTKKLEGINLNLYKLDLTKIVELIDENNEYIEELTKRVHDATYHIRNIVYTQSKKEKINLGDIEDFGDYYVTFIRLYDDNKETSNTLEEEFNRIANLGKDEVDSFNVYKLVLIAHLIFKSYIGYSLERIIVRLLEEREFKVIRSKSLDERKIDILFEYKGCKIALQCKTTSFLDTTKAKKQLIKKMDKNIEEGICDICLVICHEKYNPLPRKLNILDHRERELNTYNLMAIPYENLDDFILRLSDSIDLDEFMEQLFLMVDELIEYGDIYLNLYYDDGEYDLPF